MNTFSSLIFYKVPVTIDRYFFLILILLSFPMAALAQETHHVNNNQKDSMENKEEFIPSLDGLTPYQSPIDFFKNKLSEDDTLQMVFSIKSPAESYATMIINTLEENTDYEFQITMTPIMDSATREAEFWRLHGVSKKLKYGNLSEKGHYEVAGWLYELTGYFNSDLLNVAYRL